MAGYAYLVSKIGFGIPCLFYKITGFQCPGCGITHMCLVLINGNIKEAFLANPVVFSFSPFILFLLFKSMLCYLNDKKFVLNRYQSIFCKIIIITLLCYGIIRNII